MAPGSNKGKVVVYQKGSKQKKLVTPIRGKIKRQIFAGFMRKLKDVGQKTILFLFCKKAGDREFVILPS